MQRAKVNQRSRSFPGRSEAHVKKNMFDLSHDVKTTFTMGKLVPILTMEVLPGDEWFIRGEYMMRFAPLYLPIMHRVNMSVDYYFVPNRIMWPQYTVDSGDPENFWGWENFIFNPESGLEHPYYSITPSDPSVGGSEYMELIDYMGFPTELPGFVDAVTSFNVNAFPIMAYYMIWDQYYRNDQLQDNIVVNLLFTGNNVPPTVYGTTVACMFRNWNRDTFTSATYEPQLGSDVLIPLVDSDDPHFIWTKLDGTFTTAGTNLAQVGDDATPFGHTSDGLGNELIPVGGAPIAELRYALMLQEYAERLNRAGDRYSDNMKVFFDENPYEGVIQVPIWLGSKRGKVVVSEVMSTAETATLKVGSYAGQALSLESMGDTISYHCKEHGIIMGIISVFPDSSYMQGAENMWWRQLSTDYAWEQFALIGDQAILNREVNLDISTTPVNPAYNTDTFGYQRRYHEYIYHQDVYSGQMRSVFISFHLGRILSINVPELTVLDSTFIECRPDVTRVFQVVEGEDEIYAHIYNDIKILRRLPKFGVPAV